MGHRLLGFGITLIMDYMDNRYKSCDYGRFFGSRSQLQRNKKYYLTMLTPPQVTPKGSTATGVMNLIPQHRVCPMIVVLSKKSFSTMWKSRIVLPCKKRPLSFNEVGFPICLRSLCAWSRPGAQEHCVHGMGQRWWKRSRAEGSGLASAWRDGDGRGSDDFSCGSIRIIMG